MKNKIPLHYKLFLYKSWVSLLFFDLLTFYDYKQNRRASKGVYKVMIKMAEQNGVKPYDWTKFKYWARALSFSWVMTTIFFIACKYIDINVYWNLIPTTICNILFIENYNRIMRFLNSGNTYFWLIMAFMFAVALVFLCEIFVRFYLQTMT